MAIIILILAFCVSPGLGALVLLLLLIFKTIPAIKKQIDENNKRHQAEIAALNKQIEKEEKQRQKEIERQQKMLIREAAIRENQNKMLQAKIEKHDERLRKLEKQAESAKETWLYYGGVLDELLLKIEAEKRTTNNFDRLNKLYQKEYQAKQKIIKAEAIMENYEHEKNKKIG